MILSMTGFGRTKLNLNGKVYTIEIKALNSKGLDFNIRLQPIFRDREMDIRMVLGKQLIRGKIDCLIQNEPGDENKAGELNPNLVHAYMQQLGQMAEGFPISQEKLFELALQFPNVLGSNGDSISQEQWPLVEAALLDAAKEFTSFRKQEGLKLHDDLKKRIEIILQVLDQVETLDPERVQKSKDRLLQSMRQVISEEQIDMNRFEQELIYYLEKMDITEEITRLRSHCSYFIECMANNDGEKGKKLAFISQEIGREINTIGAKSYHAEMQKLVVAMKDELEKIKEQLNNVL